MWGFGKGVPAIGNAGKAHTTAETSRQKKRSAATRPVRFPIWIVSRFDPKQMIGSKSICIFSPPGLFSAHTALLH